MVIKILLAKSGALKARVKRMAHLASMYAWSFFIDQIRKDTLNSEGEVNIWQMRPIGEWEGLFTRHGHKETEKAKNLLCLLKQAPDLADNFLSGNYDVLGRSFTPILKVESKNQSRCFWNMDPPMGYVWDRRCYKAVEVPYGKGDIKVPWELSRFYFGVNLGQAFAVTGDERYARAFKAIIEDWSMANPLGLGVNWACPMEVAIRAANWVASYILMRDSKAFDEVFEKKFLKWLWLHAFHVEKNLEKWDVANNHYLADLVGLLYVGCLLKGTREARRWTEIAVRELEKEIERQVNPDGTSFEASTCYHRLVCELLFYAHLVAERNGLTLSEGYRHRLEKMFEFSLFALKPDGSMPQIGDNDSGRLHVLAKRRVLDMSYLPALGAICFNRPDFKLVEYGFSSEALWVFGFDGYQEWSNMEGRSCKDLDSKAFPEGGYYILRKNRDYMMFYCGGVGLEGLGAHAHNDKLSFEICFGGCDLMIDPGTFSYTGAPSWRNHFRSTRSHNTIMVDGCEQAEMDERPEGLFRLPDSARCTVTEFRRGDSEDYVEAFHDGYSRLNPPVRHLRKVVFQKLKRRFVITDHVMGTGRRRLESFLHLAPGVMVKGWDKGEVLVRTRSGERVRIVCKDEDGRPLTTSLEQGWYSPEYGVMLPIHRIVFCLVTELPARLTLEIAVGD